MRIYGSSPLYNYVELIFRCKRMFIVAIILGTVITSAVVYMRSDRYDASMLIQLAGDPDLTRNFSGDQRQTDRDITRKANRLMRWVQRDPQFLNDVLKDARLDLKYGGKFDDVVKQVRKTMPPPTMYMEDQQMEVSLTWKDPEEATAILNALYNRYALKTLDTETAAATGYRQMLDDQFQKAEREANDKAQKRVAYLTSHYWVQPSLMSASMGNLDQTETEINEVRMDIADANVRLAEINRQLATTPQRIDQGQEVTSVQEDPALRLSAEKQDLETQLKQLLQTYSNMHPKVQDIQKKIAAIDEQIKAARKGTRTATSTTTRTNRTINPAWQELKQQQQQLIIASRAQERRLTELEGLHSKNQSHVTQMPQAEIDFSKIDRDYSLADTIRRNLQTKLAAARIDEAQARATKAKEMELIVPPRAEKLDSGGKAMLLYLLGPVLGLIIAFAFSLAAESLDHTLRTPVEVERYLGKPVLAVLPRMRPSREEQKRLAGSSKPSITS